jgi:sugar/nucleoside kinase (ribokinase family)
VSVDLACGERAFLDLTFVALERLPRPGEERFAADLVRSPGGAAITAVGAARLGLETALVSPLGADREGCWIREQLTAEGIRCTGRTVERTPVTAVLPAEGERAMATYDPGDDVRAEELQAVAPRAVVLSLPRLELAPPSARLYATAGDLDVRTAMDGPPPGLTGARALILNEREALLLTGARSAEEAARRLGEHVREAVVTVGAGGAIAVAGGELVRAPGIDVEVVDTTGAGDLFTAAYAWSDHRGAPLQERLAWAVLYASLSVRIPTGVAGAATLGELVEAGARHGLELRR